MFGASWLWPIGFKFSEPNFRLSQEFSGTKSTIEKNEALSISFVGMPILVALQRHEEP